MVDEQIRRDNEFRETATRKAEEEHARLNPAPSSAPDDIPRSLGIPIHQDSSMSTLRPGMDFAGSPNTPGFGINAGTPASAGYLSTSMQSSVSPFPAFEPGTPDIPSAHPDGGPSSFSDRSGDYFSSRLAQESEKAPMSPSDANSNSGTPQSPAEPETHERKRGGSLFSKKFRMEFPKKLGRTSTDQKPQIQEKTEESEERASVKEEKVYEPNIIGVVDRIRSEYQDFLTANPGRELVSSITPSTEKETPELNIPPRTGVFIQEETGDTAVAADLYRGSMDRIGNELPLLEKAIPHWLGELLLKVSKSI